MKRHLCSLTVEILVFCLLFSAASAGGIGDMLLDTDVIEAINNAENIPFSPIATEMFDSDWISSSALRATLTVLLAFDLANEGYPEAANGIMDYNSYIGLYGNMFIIAGMYKGHAFNIYYMPSEHAAVYRVAAVALSEEKIQSSIESTVLSCTEHYLNSKKDIVSFNDVFASSNK